MANVIEERTWAEYSHNSPYNKRSPGQQPVSVLSLDDCFASIRARIDDAEARAAEMERILKEYNHDVMLDRKVQELTAELARLRAENRGFILTAEESAAIDKWKETHELKRHWDPVNNASLLGEADGAHYTYRFEPMDGGMLGSIKCTCGAKFRFRDTRTVRPVHHDQPDVLAADVTGAEVSAADDADDSDAD